MSLYHISYNLNTLSYRRQNANKIGIPLILLHYDMYRIIFPDMSHRGRTTIKNYVIKRIPLFTNYEPPFFSLEESPGSIVRNSLFRNPFIEFAVQNPRRRR